ncbi:MAG: ETC complex I subunit [Pseudomonadota bacterium]
MKARIYKPSKTTMQSARGKTKEWVLEYETTSRRGPEPLMGWTASGDTLNQVKLYFDDKQSAIAFAKKNGLTYSVAKVRERKVKPRNYGDNFKYFPPTEDSA